eukprot:TRINITY_DN713_c0_g1_i1.p1 TRINITY_DN713_c0_g1~~TRINITY_DN713_c0_g1_i1.p1  ORF type:complete len:532 (+),score=78.48 TRINITY_DN713_c0_g1_i1:20-1615(+)
MRSLPLISLICCLLRVCLAEEGSVFVDANGMYTFQHVFDTNSVAFGLWNDTLESTGWSILKITTNPKFADLQQAYAAGYLEGALTTVRTWQNFNNMYPKWNNSSFNPLVQKFLLSNIQFVEDSIRNHTSSPDAPMYDHWFHVALIWQQLRGLADGYAKFAGVGQEIDFFAFYVLQSTEDIGDVQTALGLSINPAELSPEQFENWFVRQGHCSSLVKVAADLSDVFIGHTTWSGYLNMLRIFKTYTFPFNNQRTSAKQVHFSGYPGQIASIDDFFVMDNGMITTETTIENFNLTLAQQGTTPESLFYWIRVILANRVASNPKEWAGEFSKFNSGTYNNEWMVLNIGAFVPGQPLPEGMLYVVDQMPTIVKSTDRTAALAYGYWPSYNVPSDPEIYNIAGYPALVKQQGPWMLSYQTCVRAEIFRRDNGKATNLTSFASLLRYNDWENDPLSHQNSVYAISARADLKKSGPSCFGGIDTKAISATAYHNNRVVLAQSGPTHDQQPAFSYDKMPCSNHEGQPTNWQFPWVLLEP